MTGHYVSERIISINGVSRLRQEPAVGAREKFHSVKGCANSGRKLWPDPPVGTREKMHTITAGGETFSVSDQAFKALTLIALRHGSGNPYTFAARMLEAEADRGRVTAYFRDTIGKIFRGESWRAFGCPNDEDLTRSSVQQ